MTKKRFTNIEHDYENAWIKCNDDGDFMIYSIYKELDESLPSLEDLLNGLSEENEQLKQVIKEVLKLLKEEVDLFSDKAIEHDIQAYIELGELDNKDAYYMAISTKKAIKLLREMIE